MRTTWGKAEFLKLFLISELSILQPHRKGLWGKMNAQQMIEHLAYSFRNYAALDHENMNIPPERIEQARHFMLSEKPFTPGTHPPGMSLYP
ncbi:MAG: hypothetical protein LC117_01700 [Bacteroidia bacterium]|nr:hypothetical protein [Bacteroidia bacterium]MCZ2276629.1 hypothetical protein [Bacteroidia bacterium]